MTRALCAGMDPEWWTPGDDGNRLAAAICRRCAGCPDNDPTPHGVIRQGVAYTDSGIPLPDCPGCGYPHTTYRGGDVSLCDRCAVPRVAIPDPRRVRTSMVLHLVGQGFTDREIGARLRVSVGTVRRTRTASGCLRRPGHRTEREAA